MGRKTLEVAVQTAVVSGALADSALLKVVLGRAVRGTAVDAAGQTGAALTLHGLTRDDHARLTFFAGAVAGGHMVVSSQTVPQYGVPTGATFQSDAEILATARDVMALFGVKSGAEVRARAAAMAVRGAARVRAAQPGPVTLRRNAGAADIAVQDRREPYARFFAVEEYDLRHRRFDGTISAHVTRAVFISGDAVTVLPYDPVRDRVLLIEQVRAGPFARGDVQPWQLEAIAGRIDQGETPQDAARREAVEEAGLHLDALLEVAQYYPSPGICAEYLYSYLAITDLPDDAAGVFGLATEAEDIRGHLVSFDAFMALVASGEIANAPLILTAFWLAANRDGLRAPPPLAATLL